MQPDTKTYSRALIVFVRKPELGKVKTRLAATVGDEQALDIYNLLVQHTQLVASAVPSVKLVYYAPAIVDKDFWSGADIQKRLQPEGDLGQKMEAAFREALTLADKAIIVGSDCAELTPGIIGEAYDALDRADVAIGPATDGGYYLLGMKKLHPFLFQDMVWSTEMVYQQTVDRIEQAGLSHHVLPVLSDVDFEEDWQRTKHLIAGLSDD